MSDLTKADTDRQLCIAIDYDGTYTAEPTLWDNLIITATNLGHRCYIVTCRGREDIDEISQMTGVPKGRIYCTGGSAKRWFMNRTDVKIDIWIDDEPASIENAR